MKDIEPYTIDAEHMDAVQAKLLKGLLTIEEALIQWKNLALHMQQPSLMPMEKAPKNRPILAYCVNEDECSKCGPKTMCLYHAHAEGLSVVPTGFAIVEWGGAFDDSTWEHPNQGSLPDWWFQVGSDFECVANPVGWWPLPRVPKNASDS